MPLLSVTPVPPAAVAPKVLLPASVSVPVPVLTIEPAVPVSAPPSARFWLPATVKTPFNNAALFRLTAVLLDRRTPSAAINWPEPNAVFEPTRNSPADTVVPPV